MNIVFYFKSRQKQH